MKAYKVNYKNLDIRKLKDYLIIHLNRCRSSVQPSLSISLFPGRLQLSEELAAIIRLRLLVEHGLEETTRATNSRQWRLGRSSGKFQLGNRVLANEDDAATQQPESQLIVVFTVSQ